MRLEGKVAIIVGAGQSPLRGSGTAVRRRSASRKKAPGSWPSTGLSPPPRRPPQWRRRVASAYPSPPT
jgi:hypothetical protein